MTVGALWWIIPVLAVLGWGQRFVPWALSAWFGDLGNRTRWIQELAPAAFAALLVMTIPVHAGWPVLLILLVAAVTQWRAANLGLTVLVAVGAGVLLTLAGVPGL